MKKAAVENEIPAQPEKERGKEVSEGFPDHESAQDQKEEISGYHPMKEDLTRMVLGCQRIRF